MISIENPVAIAEGIRADHPAAMEALYGFLNKQARFWIARHIHDEVDDCVHDVFLAVVKQLRQGALQHPEKLSGFVSVIIWRTIAERFERNDERRRLASLDTPPDQMPIVVRDPAPNPETQLWQKQRRQIAHKSLRQMKPTERELLMRSFALEQDHARMSAAMRLTPRQCENQKHKAKVKFANIGLQLITPSRLRRHYAAAA